jgi:polyisoprenoid-binding protein YceI
MHSESPADLSPAHTSMPIRNLLQRSWESCGARLIVPPERKLRTRCIALAAGLLLLGAPLACAQISAWKSDPTHSEINFTIRHLSLSDVHGRFDDVNAVIRYDPADVAKSTVTASIPVDTVSTGEPGRDDVIKSSDFFDVDQFPRASFTSTEISKAGDGLWIKGNLSLHGITRPVVLKVSGPVKPMMGPDGKPHSGFLATATLDRTAFDIGSTFPAAIVGDQVQLVIRLNVVKE